ncbi:fluoride efflux transporter CrcB [Akkermansia sp. N21169]|uniref:fluoride efflux transporter CrcB n=2 Tax=unclassified Akkermansia TaxID=2608915 RepID=UPI00244EBB83|nr:fluoride efflux transporter CrcB [Akkermansia sp. N21116]MDH3067848.1 fluoride efflux transporter CrcB [Akkermansia sp. N21169]WPX41709.1 fluoride efflux transporter CrcB [Akkermansia sp. N21116]
MTKSICTSIGYSNSLSFRSMLSIQEILCVMISGAIGVLARYLISIWAVSKIGTGFPYGTFIVNIAGCFIMGVFMVLSTERFIASPYAKLIVGVGFLGGLTTFGSFSYETLYLFQNGQILKAGLNLFGNVGIGLFATLAGAALTRLAL